MNNYRFVFNNFSYKFRTICSSRTKKREIAIQDQNFLMYHQKNNGMLNRDLEVTLIYSILHLIYIAAVLRQPMLQYLEQCRVAPGQ